MKALLFSKFTVIFGLALASALSVRHFARFLQHQVRLNSSSAITRPLEAAQQDQPPVNDLTEPAAIEVRAETIAHFDSDGPTPSSRGTGAEAIL